MKTVCLTTPIFFKDSYNPFIFLMQLLPLYLSGKGRIAAAFSVYPFFFWYKWVICSCVFCVYAPVDNLCDFSIYLHVMQSVIS